MLENTSSNVEFVQLYTHKNGFYNKILYLHDLTQLLRDSMTGR